METLKGVARCRRKIAHSWSEETSAPRLNGRAYEEAHASNLRSSVYPSRNAEDEKSQQAFSVFLGFQFQTSPSAAISTSDSNKDEVDCVNARLRRDLVDVGNRGVAGSLSKDEAYVTLLYGDEFLLGVRVLGKSIRDTGSTKDMVVLVSDGVSDYAKKLLQADGWIVEVISLLANPNSIRPKRFWGVYTKLKIFNMTNYKKVVYLDADTIVLKNIDELFKCGKFCANLKHSERLNSGVMVVEPSEVVFKDMMSKVKTLHSYTGGDQGFLNSYYVGFANAHVFDPSLSSEELNSRPVPEMEKLSTLYNADVGLYMLANKNTVADSLMTNFKESRWMVDEKELRVIHYTLGPLKPWDWWTAWLLKPVDIWQIARENLQESLPGTGGGRNPTEQLLVKDMFGAFGRSSIFHQARHLFNKFKAVGGLATYSAVSVASSSIANSNQQNRRQTIGYLYRVYKEIVPKWWTIEAACIFRYLYLVYEWGKTTATQTGSFPTYSEYPESSEYNSGKGHQRQVSICDAVSWFYWIGMAFLAVAVPALPCMLGITALFVRLGLMVAGGLVLVSFMTYASEHLAIRAFVRGREDCDQARNGNVCFIC
ncbi:hypothetical protein ACLOJK_011494 [Asimina triloba]